MNYALIENNVVINIICLHPTNASEFPNAIFTDNLPIEIGDTYIDGVFYRNGEEVKSHVAITSEEGLLNRIMEEVSEHEY